MKRKTFASAALAVGVTLSVAGASEAAADTSAPSIASSTELSAAITGSIDQQGLNKANKRGGPYGNWFSCRFNQMKVDALGIKITKSCYKSNGKYYFNFRDSA